VTANKTALLFPGQGAQCAAMIDALRSLPGFEEGHEVVCSKLDFDPIEHIQTKDPNAINANVVSSALTVLASVLALEQFREANPFHQAVFSGYSVGQWTALYASHVVSFEKLVEIVAHRATLMDKCSAKRPGAMLAVIGVAPEPLIELCEELSSANKVVAISNYNSYGQYTLSGDVALIDIAHDSIIKLSPKKLARVPVAGAWHSSILDEAASEFEEYLRTCSLNPPDYQVIDNVTGDYLNSDPELMIETLAKHISHPVQWHKGMLRLIADGVTECIEIGYGNTLTKFGMFIDRSVDHRAFFACAVTA
jgi:[acyl-carrier-protein] S-malonyltransferase